MKTINDFFFQLTKRNWGVWSHYILVQAATALWLGFFGFWAINAFTGGLWALAFVYELYQIKEGQTWLGFAEDMVANILGYLSAIGFYYWLIG
jgi:hypothetical protein